MSSHHDDTNLGNEDADFKGLSLDSRFFLSRTIDPNQIYLLAGVGIYSIRKMQIYYVSPSFTPEVFDQKLKGYGLNLGAGLEHYRNKHVALNFGLIYRIIRYNEREINGRTEPLSPYAKGDMLTLEAGFNYHF